MDTEQKADALPPWADVVDSELGVIAQMLKALYPSVGVRLLGMIQMECGECDRCGRAWEKCACKDCAKCGLPIAAPVLAVGEDERCASCGDDPPGQEDPVDLLRTLNARIHEEEIAGHFSHELMVRLDRAANTPCEKCGGPITFMGAHGFGCEDCADAELDALNADGS